MTPLKIVIVSKNCYPALGPRAHRTTELAKELAKMGHNVIVYALLGDFNYESYSKATGITFKNLGISRGGVTDNLGYYNRSFIAKVLRRLFSKALEFPSIELIPMVKKALMQEKEIDYLITIAQPHTIHWGAAMYVKNTKVKFWVADCGDPFMKNQFNKPPFYFENFEKHWGKLCNYITIPIAEAKEAYYSEFRKKIKVIPQGFQFDNLNIADFSPNSIPTFAFSGIVYKDFRDPSSFLNYLTTLKLDFKFIIYTNQESFYDEYSSKLGEKLELRSYVPRNKLLFELSKMDFLINIMNKSSFQQPSKLIDYSMTNRPILEITSKFYEKEQFEQFISGDYKNQMRIKNLQKYNIVNVANDFINLYNNDYP
ncbi:glycosyltransferase family protein [Arenibacter latericius]|uniref:hypothetical protein n=1 Tax=Arenibacter latericius TaxID=86104 RepID=UPI000412FAF1|nr:hypothetical protein [Arenibacter latericius]